MDQPDNDRGHRNNQTIKSSLIMFLFGLSILAFLTAIDRPHWFHIRPFSALAQAMSHVSTDGGADRADDRR